MGNLCTKLAVIAAIVFGFAVMTTGVASAHHVTVTGQASCLAADGSWSVTWTALNSEAAKTMDIIQGSGSDTDGFVDLAGGGVNYVDGTDPTFGPDPVPFSGSATAVLNYASNVASAKVRVEADWTQFSGTDTDEAVVSKPTTPCVVDVCPNIAGVQATVPAGKIVVDGQCVDPNCENSPTYFNNHLDECVPPVEVCINGVIVTFTGSQQPAPQSTNDCGPASYCFNGEIVEGTEYQANTLDTDDCGPVEVCVDGKTVTATEYEVNEGIVVATDDCGPATFCQDGKIVLGTEYDAANNDTEDCEVIQVCVDGETIVGTEFEIGDLVDTGDCGTVIVCVDGEFEAFTEAGAPRDTRDCGTIIVCDDGETVAVTEYEADRLNLQEGACPPPPTPDPLPPVIIVNTVERIVETPVVITPPSTGDAGLLDEDGTALDSYAIGGLMLLGALGLVALAGSRRRGA